MSRRTSEASKAIRKAWEREQNWVLEGKGTRDWTREQQESIIEKGKAYDENGRAFEGHHMKSAEAYPEYQGDPENIQFLSRDEHQYAHDGSFQNPTNGYYDPETQTTTEFGDEKYIPCDVIELSDPIINEEENVSADNNSQENSSKDQPVNESDTEYTSSEINSFNDTESHESLAQEDGIEVSDNGPDTSEERSEMEEISESSGSHSISGQPEMEMEMDLDQNHNVSEESIINSDDEMNNSSNTESASNLKEKPEMDEIASNHNASQSADHTNEMDSLINTQDSYTQNESQNNPPSEAPHEEEEEENEYSY